MTTPLTPPNSQAQSDPSELTTPNSETPQLKTPATPTDAPPGSPQTNPNSQTHKLANSPTGGGRPTKLTPAVRAGLMESLRAGMTYAEACAELGISRETLRLWRKGNPALCTSIGQAEAEAADTHITIINKAAEKNWRAAAWWLERRRPETWGQARSLTVARKLEFAYLDRSPAHEAELTPIEVDLRTALYLPADAPEEEVRQALERAKINLMRSRAYGIPVDQLPK